MFKLLLCITFVIIASSNAAPDPTLYEYYTSGGIHSGLKADHEEFTLNGKQFVIYSGSFHYFRVVPQNWRAVLARFKAAGLNSVSLYLPWNLHEDTPDHFDFESDGLNLAKFLEEIKRADMFAIVRPGPYICAEWELGGYPSWMLRDPHIEFRTMNLYHIERVHKYMEHSLKIINRFQFTSGGPVIMLQLENEYGFAMKQPYGPKYLQFLHEIVVKSGFTQLLFASDPSYLHNYYPIKGVFANNSVLQTANFNGDSEHNLNELRRLQPHKPVMVSEFWSGWFDKWGDANHHQSDVAKFEHEVSTILLHIKGSINFYMFIGGTNFGYTSAWALTTSYDYDAPLSEAGNYTAKYYKTRELYQKLVASGRHPKVHLPDIPAAPIAHAYGNVPIENVLPLEAILERTLKFTNVYKPVPMELLNITDKYGQRFGFIVYRVESKAIHQYEVAGEIHDHGVFMVDNVEKAVTKTTNFRYNFTEALPVKSSFYRYDVLVENMGRPDGGAQSNTARKGITVGDIKLDGHVVNNFTIFSLDLNASFVNTLNALTTDWHKFDSHSVYKTPALYRAHLAVDLDDPADTYLYIPGWTHGNAFVNGFNIGRYRSPGLQKTLYIPGALLKQGSNTVEMFELHKPGHELRFLDRPNLG